MNSASANIASTSGASRHVAGVSLNGPLAISLVAVALVALAVAVGFAGVVTSVFRGSIHDAQPKMVIDDLVTKHDQKAGEYAARFNKRYIFYKPPPPPPPPQPPRREEPPPPPEPPDTGPKIPATYQGPSVAWVIGDDVYFSMVIPTQTEKYMRVRVGEERNGVKVLSTEKMPRTIRVAHMGGEYDVKVFGDAMNSVTLFPTTPRPSITVPGFIPAGQPAPVSSDGDATTSAAVDDANSDALRPAEAEGIESSGLNAEPADGQERRTPPGRDRRRGGDRPRGERPEGERRDDGDAVPAPRPA